MSGSPSTDLASILLGAIAPQLAAGQAEIASTGLAAQLAPYQYGLQSQFAGQEYQNQLAQLGLTQQGLGLESGYLGTQKGLAGAQYGLTTGTPGDVGGGGLYAQLANLGFQYPLAQQAQGAQAAATGATNTVGNQNAMAGLAEQFRFNTGNLENQLGQAGLGYQGQLAGLGYQAGQLGLQGQGLTLEQQLLGQQYGYQTAQDALTASLTAAQDRSAQLGAIGNQWGLAQQALAPLGILQGSSFAMPGGLSGVPNTGN